VAALPSSPSSLSLNQIAGEFGGSVPHSLSEYYAGGGIVPSGTTGDSGAIPTSGSISIGQFYGSRQRVSIALTISSATTNYQISASRGGTYEAGFTDIVLTNNSQVGSNSVGTAALWTGPNASWSTGDTIRVVNGGAIRGRGGNGGAGMPNTGQPAQNGQAGGDAIELNYPITLQNTNQVRAAGGGGGGGARGSTVIAGQPGNPPSKAGPGQPGNPPSTQFFGGGGGGGGAGIQAGSGGAGANSQGQPGQAGSANTRGAGGDSSGQTNPNGGNGGAAGAAGQQGTGTGDGAGGAAGKAVERNGYTLTLQNSGTVIGAT
jgi:hypothetical protein